MAILQRDVAPFLFWFSVFVATAIAADFTLHAFQLVWIGRYLGIVGVVVILVGLIPYSLQKRKLIAFGDPAGLLRFHESTGWIGSLFVLVHAGVHFNAILPWLTLVAMLITVASGLTGVFLLRRARQDLEEAKLAMRSGGTLAAQIEEELFWDALTLDVLKKWRNVHVLVSSIFGGLAITHIITIFMFWGWW